MKKIYNIVEVELFDNNVNTNIKSFKTYKKAVEYLNTIILDSVFNYLPTVFQYEYDCFIDYLPDKYGVLKSIRLEESEIE